MWPHLIRDHRNRCYITIESVIKCNQACAQVIAALVEQIALHKRHDDDDDDADALLNALTSDNAR